MGIKSIISTVAFAGAFTLSTGLTMLWPGQQSQPAPTVAKTYTSEYKSKCSKGTGANHYDTTQQRRISQFMQRDIDNGSRRMDAMILANINNESGTVWSGKFADAVTEYVESSSAMDDSALPSDFRTAWRAHMKAWRDHANLLNTYKKNPHGELEVSALELYQEQDEAISDTWMEVKQVAYRYGATFNE